MGITVGAAMKKVAAILLSDPKTLKKVLFAILVVLVALLLPMVMVVCLFSGKFRVDTEDLQRHVEANLTAADVQLLRSVEDTMAEIEFAMIDAELSSEVGAAQALYIMALYDYSSQPGFVSRLVSCFGEEQTDDQLVANVNAAFGTDIVVQDFTNVMRNVRSRRIDTTKYVDCGTKNNLDLVQWAISACNSGSPFLYPTSDFKTSWRTLERGVIMADTSALGQSVPKSQEGLFLMDGIEGLLSLPRHSVDMLLTDPPYGTTRNYWDVPLPLDALWEAVRWAVKPNGAALFFAQCPYDKVLGASNLAMLRYEWIWYKERGTGFLNANRAPLKKSENILVFYQKSPAYFPQFTYGEPYSKVHARKGSSPNYGKFERQGSSSNDGRRYPGNVLFVQTVAHPAHPTQKPVELCEYLIKTYTRPGEVVADLCAGSGTTAVAALNTGRRFVCFESAPAIYGPAVQRIEQARLAVERGEKGHGLGTKDYIAPDSFDFRDSRTFRVGRYWGAASYLQILASELSDKLLAEILELDAELTVTMHIQTVDQLKAIKTIKGKISDMTRRAFLM